VKTYIVLPEACPIWTPASMGKQQVRVLLLTGSRGAEWSFKARAVVSSRLDGGSLVSRVAPPSLDQSYREPGILCLATQLTHETRSSSFVEASLQ
jgi:hypothetical protein